MNTKKFLQLSDAKSILDLHPSNVADLVRKLNLKCTCCGYNETIGEFHHVDNKFDNSHANLVYVCPNCRKRIHYGLIRKNSLVTLQSIIGDDWKTIETDDDLINIVFPDIDGVLNTPMDIKKRHAAFVEAVKNNESTPEKLIKDKYGILFDDICVHFFRRFIEISKSKIVLSSSWKSSWIISYSRYVER